MEEEDPGSQFLESAKMHLAMWSDKWTFYNWLLAMDLLPVDVPADGNCALWSMAALKAGAIVQTERTTQEDIQHLRED